MNAPMLLQGSVPTSLLSHRQRPTVLARPFVRPFRLHAAGSENPEGSKFAFERDERPPPENIGNAAKEIAKDRSKAGAQDVDMNPKGGSGFEPKPVDGEGQGYSMKDIVEKTSSRNKEEREGEVGEEASVEDVE